MTTYYEKEILPLKKIVYCIKNNFEGARLEIVKKHDNNIAATLFLSEVEEFIFYLESGKIKEVKFQELFNKRNCNVHRKFETCCIEANITVLDIMCVLNKYIIDKV